MSFRPRAARPAALPGGEACWWQVFASAWRPKSTSALAVGALLALLALGSGHVARAQQADATARHVRPPPAMAECITSDNLKAEILEAYNDLQVERRVLQEKVEDLEEENAQLEEEKQDAEGRTLPTGDGAPSEGVDAIVEALSRLRGQFSGAINRPLRPAS